MQRRDRRCGRKGGVVTIVGRFEIEYRQCLDAHGRPLGDLPASARDAGSLVQRYRTMVLARAFDQKMLTLQRTGQLGTFAPGLGKEAVDVGVASAMQPEDALLITYREMTAQIARGVSLLELLTYWGGDERGSDFAGPRGDWPVCITIASHCVHAVGVAYAYKLRKQPRVAVCMLGDGGTSKGEFYEAMNGAGVWRLPVVFVATNNRYAISVPCRLQTAAATLAQKAVAAGIAGIQVDGNDLIAVHDAALEAVARARSGGGPTLIEALSYRLSDHTTADDASRYRDAGEVSEAWKLEPIGRLRSFLLDRGVWSRADEEALTHACGEQIQTAVDAYLARTPPDPAQMFAHLHAALPAAYEAQRRDALARGGGHG